MTKPNQSNILSTAEIIPSVFIQNLISLANEKSYAIACWSLPQDSALQLIINTSSKPTIGKVAIENTEPGYMISAFQNAGLEQSVYLSADLYYSTSTNCIEIAPSLDSAIKDKLEEIVNAANISTIIEHSFNYHNKNNSTENSNQKSFEESVKHAIAAIEANQLKKVVISRFQDFIIKAPKHLFEIFDKIVNTMRGAFTSFISVPTIGTWMGASPEIMIQIIDSQYFKTVSLAGTQQASQFEKLSEVSWKQKEIEEQAFVSRYIIECFKKIRLREYEEDGPKTIKAANLIHLKSEFTVDMIAANFEQLGSVMLELLHPTSAVCGMPLLAAQDFILQHENYDRELYSGFAGPVNIKNQTHLFVNLRCMQVYANKARLYAGAGITDSSDPKKEWQETEYKLQTLQSLIAPYVSIES
jgi:isochorismate synthase